MSTLVAPHDKAQHLTSSFFVDGHGYIKDFIGYTVSAKIEVDTIDVQNGVALIQGALLPGMHILKDGIGNIADR
ncbi:hypothetical protein D3C76_1161740 [compost metagenome]